MPGTTGGCTALRAFSADALTFLSLTLGVGTVLLWPAIPALGLPITILIGAVIILLEFIKNSQEAWLRKNRLRTAAGLGKESTANEIPESSFQALIKSGEILKECPSSREAANQRSKKRIKNRRWLKLCDCIKLSASSLLHGSASVLVFAVPAWHAFACLRTAVGFVLPASSSVTALAFSSSLYVFLAVASALFGRAGAPVARLTGSLLLLLMNGLLVAYSFFAAPLSEPSQGSQGAVTPASPVLAAALVAYALYSHGRFGEFLRDAPEERLLWTPLAMAVGQGLALTAGCLLGSALAPLGGPAAVLSGLAGEFGMAGAWAAGLLGFLEALGSLLSVRDVAVPVPCLLVRGGRVVTVLLRESLPVLIGAVLSLEGEGTALPSQSSIPVVLASAVAWLVVPLEYLTSPLWGSLRGSAGARRLQRALLLFGLLSTAGLYGTVRFAGLQPLQGQPAGLAGVFGTTPSQIPFVPSNEIPFVSSSPLSTATEFTDSQVSQASQASQVSQAYKMSLNDFFILSALRDLQNSLDEILQVILKHNGIALGSRPAGSLRGRRAQARTPAAFSQALHKRIKDLIGSRKIHAGDVSSIIAVYREEVVKQRMAERGEGSGGEGGRDKARRSVKISTGTIPVWHRNLDDILSEFLEGASLAFKEYAEAHKSREGQLAEVWRVLHFSLKDIIRDVASGRFAGRLRSVDEPLAEADRPKGTLLPSWSSWLCDLLLPKNEILD